MIEEIKGQAVLAKPIECLQCHKELRDFGDMTQHTIVLRHPALVTRFNGSTFILNAPRFIE